MAKDGDETQALEERLPSLPKDWPDDVKEAIQTLFQYDGRTLEGREEYGSQLAFDGVENALRRLREMLVDVASTRWADLPSTVTESIKPTLDEGIATLNEIKAFDVKSANAYDTRQSLLNRLTEVEKWFRDHLKIYADLAALKRGGANGADPEGANNLQQTFRELSDQASEITKNLDEHADVVEGFRAASSEKAAGDLGRFYGKRASDCQEQAHLWLKLLIGSVTVAIVATIALYLLLTPDGSADASDIGRLTLSAFILGLLVYLVRVCGQQYRSQRHMEAIARSKKVAADTFPLINGSVSSDEIRSGVTMALAQAVFQVEETGLGNNNGEQVTLVERAVMPRIVGPGSSE